MAARQRTSRRNRQFGPSPEVPLETLDTSFLREVTQSFSSHEADIENVEVSSNTENNSSNKLKREILSSDFPSRDGDIEVVGRRDTPDGIADELGELLRIGAISESDASNLLTFETLPEETYEETPDFSDHKSEIPDFDEDGLPVNWTKNTGTSGLYALVKLRRGDEVFDSIMREFGNVNIPVKKVERLQNKRLLEKFKGEAQDIQDHRTEDFSLNVKYLYHGSNAKKETLCEEGLDQRLSTLGYFGRGIYFSDNPLKCVHYAEDCKQDGPYEAYILKCRVILGDIKMYPKGTNDIDLKREPEKETPTHGSKYYDSVLGCPKDFNEFVVYENRRAMIEYIITFQADDSVIRNLRQLGKTFSQGNPGVVKQLQGADALPLTRDTFQSEDPVTQELGDTFQSEDPVTEAVDDTFLSEDPVIEEVPTENPEDQYNRISDIREAVRKKRLGNSYVPPSNEQKKREKEMWTKIQTRQGIQTEEEKSDYNSEMDSIWPPSQEDFSPMSELELIETQNVSGPFRGYPPVVFWDDEEKVEEQEVDWFKTEENQQTDWFSSTQGAQVDRFSHFHRGQRTGRKGEDDPVGQALSLCVAEFLAVTGLEDSDLAKHYVQKAEMDVNNAISLYYENC